MIGIDTNVLLRLLTVDDTKQHEAAVGFFKERSPSSPAFASAVTLAEMMWVLRRRYRLSREEIGRSLNQILDSDDFYS